MEKCKVCGHECEKEDIKTIQVSIEGDDYLDFCEMCQSLESMEQKAIPSGTGEQ